MAECILYNGGMFNNDYLTAKPEDVKYGQTFIGAGTEIHKKELCLLITMWNMIFPLTESFYSRRVFCFNNIKTRYSNIGSTIR